MANDLTINPWRIDTASATPLTRENRVRVAHFRWVGATTAGHQCIVTDVNGKRVWSSIAGGANFVDGGGEDLNVNGLVVPTLGSGELSIQLR